VCRVDVSATASISRISRSRVAKPLLRTPPRLFPPDRHLPRETRLSAPKASAWVIRGKDIHSALFRREFRLPIYLRRLTLVDRTMLAGISRVKPNMPAACADLWAIRVSFDKIDCEETKRS
jgi:hypothetical protein